MASTLSTECMSRAQALIAKSFYASCLTVTVARAYWKLKKPHEYIHAWVGLTLWICTGAYGKGLLSNPCRDYCRELMRMYHWVHADLVTSVRYHEALNLRICGTACKSLMHGGYLGYYNAPGCLMMMIRKISAICITGSNRETWRSPRETPSNGIRSR